MKPVGFIVEHPSANLMEGHYTVMNAQLPQIIETTRLEDFQQQQQPKSISHVSLENVI